VVSNIKTGSIIVFHDSVKAFKNLEYTLPKVLKYLDENNFQCEAFYRIKLKALQLLLYYTDKSIGV
jgi:hypothetical protein